MRGEVPEIYARSGHGWRLMEARRPRPLTADQICGAFGCVRAWPCFSARSFNCSNKRAGRVSRDR